MQNEIRDIIYDFIKNHDEFGIEEINIASNDGLPIEDVEINDNKYEMEEISASAATISKAIKTVSNLLEINNVYLVLCLSNKLQISIFCRDKFSIFILSKSVVLGISEEIGQLSEKIEKELFI